jgi:hypothetical protein
MRRDPVNTDIRVAYVQASCRALEASLLLISVETGSNSSQVEPILRLLLAAVEQMMEVVNPLPAPGSPPAPAPAQPRR